MEIKKRKKIVLSIIATILIGGIFFVWWKKNEIKRTTLLVDSVAALSKIAKFLPIKEDTKKELETTDALLKEFIKNDNIERRYFILLQNNMELRPGGGFLGQYAVLKIKNGQVVSQFIEDANLLDQRINTKITPPYPFKSIMNIKNWKFRDSNFSPDFPVNVEKTKYFYRLAGNNSDFDGVIAVNASVLNHILAITGPIRVGGVEYNSENAFLKLEEQVEKVYLQNENLDTQNRKWAMKKLGEAIIGKLTSLNSLTKVTESILNDLRNKNIMLNFEDQNLQNLVAEVYWDGAVAQNWNNDYLMIVDANMGALKSDYYMRREVEYEVDLTQPKPIVYLKINYRHTATYGDWRTSDYHSYTRIYLPKDATFLERKMVGYPTIQEDLNKTYFGFKVDVLIGRNTLAEIKYELPESIKKDYQLLIQKQSGMEDMPIKIKVKTADGEMIHEDILKKDLKFKLDK